LSIPAVVGNSCPSLQLLGTLVHPCSCWELWSIPAADGNSCPSLQLLGTLVHPCSCWELLSTPAVVGNSCPSLQLLGTLMHSCSFWEHLSIPAVVGNSCPSLQLLGTLVHSCRWTCQPRLTSPFTEDLHNFVGDSSTNRDMKMKRCANTSIFITRHERSLELSKQHVQDFIKINYSLDKLCVTHCSR